ncbi:hypothetical protein BH23GEM11_BH23GEM11_06160 [soil metagenome]
MHINVHTHIFTLRTVLSREAIRVVVQRLADRGVPDLLGRAVARVLDRLLDRPEVLNERDLLARLMAELRQVSGFDRFVQDNLSRLPFNVVIRGDALEQLPLETLRSALDQLTSAMAPADDPRGRPFDIVATLRLAMKGTITEVADELLDQMEPEDAIVALMMDIRADNEPERDLRNFRLQIEGTREAALQRPGRVLPFFAVHPGRPDHFALMREGIESGAFLGVKLYPSLGYEIGSPELRRVYAFCLEADVPVLLHCSHGGFYREKAFVDYCDPRNWDAVLTGELESLRVCFAHFGGWESLGTPGGLAEGTWGGTIVRLMRERPAVYTDLAFHTDQIHDPGDEAHYFQTLAGLLDEDKLSRRILFGSDSWLLRMEMTEALFWRYFREQMSEVDFRKIAVRGPRSFLGFPEEGGGGAANPRPRANLQRHLDFLARHASQVGSHPTAWVQQLTGVDFVADREPADWKRQSVPARAVYALAREYMSGSQKNGGYAAGRILRLRDLRYWDPRDPNFEGQTCLGLARDLIGACEDHGKYAHGWDRNRAIERLHEVFRQGEETLVRVAGLLDMIFHFDRAMA